MPAEIALRRMTPADGPALARLSDEAPDTGQISFTPRYHVDAYEACLALRSDTVGVAAAVPGAPRLAGAALVSFGRCCFEDQERPYALLSALKVHPQYRRQGIAGRLARWRVDHARERLGDDGVIVAYIQKNNAGSLANARKWCRQLVGGFTVGISRMRTAPPRPEPGVSVRMAGADDLEEVAQRLDTFYREYNLYSPQSAESLSNWLRHSPFDTPFRYYAVAADKAGDIVAGAAVTEECRLRTLHVRRMPAHMRLISKAIGLVPPDGILRELSVDRVWFAPGHLAAARHLWETLRWEWRDRGSVLVAFYDPRGPLPGMLRLPAWMPRGASTLAVSAPAPLREDRLLCPLF